MFLLLKVMWNIRLIPVYVAALGCGCALSVMLCCGAGAMAKKLKEMIMGKPVEADSEIATKTKHGE